MLPTPYNFTDDPEVDWEIVLTPGALEAVTRELADQKVFSWDVESNGISPYLGKRIIGHAAAWRRPNGQIKSFYAPCRHEGVGMFDIPQQLAPELVSAAMKPALEGPALKCGQNLTFDVQMAWFDGIVASAPVFDTLVLERIKDENQRSYRLAQILERNRIKHQRGWKDAINPDIAQQMKAFKMKKKDFLREYGYRFITIPRLGVYANQDAVYELRLAEFQMPYSGQWPEIWATEMDLFWVGVDMQRIGVPIDVPYLERFDEELHGIMAELAPRIWTLAGEEFAITNDGEVRRILFEKMGYPSQGLTKGGKTGEKLNRVDDDALWALERYEGCEISGLIRQYNSAEKLSSTYTRGIIEKVDAAGILHASFNQAGAKTGRSSMEDPNLQNIPSRTALGRRIKEAFIARPGKIRACLDYSQIELRVLAHLSQDPLLLKIYREDLDAHRTTAIEAFGTADKVDGVDMRRVAKTLNFGIPFGIQEVGVGRNINKDLPEGIPPIDNAKAGGYLAAWFAKYQGVDKWRRWAWHSAAANGGLFWNMFGRPRRIVGLCSEREWERSRAERQATSTHVQGGAADLIKASMVACWKYLKVQTYAEADMVLMVHDDLQFDIAYEGCARLIREMKCVMESTCQARMSVPIKTDVEWFRDNWANKEELEL